MKYCFKILLLSFLAFLFLSCGSEQEQGVRAKTSGIYKADEKVFIEFSENFLKQEDKTPQIKANIDGKNVDLNVTYEGNKLLFSYPFKANADINANLKIANKNVRLNFKTPYLDLRQDYIKVEDSFFLSSSQQTQSCRREVALQKDKRSVPLLFPFF